jgi:hypothetical protein
VFGLKTLLQSLGKLLAYEIQVEPTIFVTSFIQLEELECCFCIDECLCKPVTTTCCDGDSVVKDHVGPNNRSTEVYYNILNKN